jgi:Fe-S-cluster containining protein
MIAATITPAQRQTPGGGFNSREVTEGPHYDKRVRPDTRTGQNPDDAFAREVERRAHGQRLEVFLSSRDAGRALAVDALANGISTARLIELAGDAARYADAAIEIVNEEYRPHLDCKEGCSYCCRKPGVLISIPELLRILDRLTTTLDADGIAAVRERAVTYTRQLNGRSFDEPTDESIPCPLLSDGRCSVYEVRPLTCRGYNSTSVDACRQAHESGKALVPIFSVIKDVTDATTVGAATALGELGFNDALVDLGTALHIALEAGGGSSDAIAGGSEVLLAAQNSSWVGELWTRVRETARQLDVPI